MTASEGTTTDQWRRDAEAEADARAHDRVSPDAVLDSIAAANLYVEALLAGVQFTDDRREAAR